MNVNPEIVTHLPSGLRPPPAPPPVSRSTPRPWVNVVLFFLTFVSTVYAQAPVLRGESFWDAMTFPIHDPGRLLAALPFAVTLMAILLAHEMGHYLTARHYGVDQSLPYFIPAPTFFGTLGAVILMRSQPPNRRVLLHVAVMGPYAGMLLALPAAAWGLAHSIPINPQAVQSGMEFGDSLLFAWLERLFSPNGTDVILHPVAMAGWVGMFITSLNLIPAAQLDGGHVSYALFGRKQGNISLAVVVALLTFGLHSACIDDDASGGGGIMWVLWAVLLFFMGLRHPPVQDESTPLAWSQRLNGMIALVLFVLTFIPVPVRMLHNNPVDDESPDLQSPYDFEQPVRPDDNDDNPQLPPSEDNPHPPEEYKL